MSSHPRVSIITVVYNAKMELDKTLKNIASIHYDNKEVIVIDGGSSDGTKSVIEKHLLDIDIWVSEPDEGLYYAMNKGLKLATGDYVWYINAGDQIFNEYTLENIFGGQEIYSDIYYGETLVVSPSGEILGLRRKRLPKRLTWQSMRKGMVVCHQSIIVKRSIAPEYDTTLRYAADVKWVIESLKRAKSIRNTFAILSIFEDGGISTKHRKESLRERFRIMAGYYGYPTTLLYHLLFALRLAKPGYRKVKKSYLHSFNSDKHLKIVKSTRLSNK